MKQKPDIFVMKVMTTRTWFDVGLLIFILQLAFLLISAEPLNEFVSHFERLDYDSNLLERTHQRVRRSLEEESMDSTLHLDFKAHGREFKLRLKRDRSIFAPDLEVVNSEFDPSKLYKGHAEGYDGSHVHGFVHNGIFEGKVRLSDKLHDEFHIEPSSDHFDTPKDYHSVIYKASDLHYPYKYGSNYDLSDKIKKQMEEARMLPEYERFSTREEAIKKTHRYRRNIPSSDSNIICQIQLQADHKFTDKRAGGMKEKALLLMSKHVQAVHDIYRQTTFEIRGKGAKGYGFAIKRMIANDTTDANEKSNPYADEYIGVVKFLDIISLEKTSKTETGRVCLNHVFTYRDFEDGVLGLAWVGEAAGGASGGICETEKSYRDGRKKTLNTGVVTFVNYNKQVPTRVSEITFAHELGHNFGAKHDTSACSDANGNYIMFPKATSGNEENNRKFSKCSIDYISPVIETKGVCFKPTNDSICGNQVVEKGEKCDCGLKEKECENQCCYHAEHKDGCKLKPGVTCSPSQGLCCEEGTCAFRNSTYKCNSGDCINDTYCNGNSAKCPAPLPKKNLTDCDDSKSVCMNGECSGSRCLKYKKTECQCSDAEHQCKLCCETDVQGKKMCKPLNESSSVELLPGAPCNDYEGYCDLLGKCRGVDSEGPLERIKNLLFGGKAISNLVEWVKTYWWAAVLIGIGLILLMAGFIKACSVATPSSNPNKPKAKTMSLRRNRHAHPNPAYTNEPPPAYAMEDIEMGPPDRGRGRGGRQNGR